MSEGSGQRIHREKKKASMSSESRKSLPSRSGLYLLEKELAVTGAAAAQRGAEETVPAAA
jgi:hypothetical protein